MDPTCSYLVGLIEEWYADDEERLAFIQSIWRGPTGLRPRWTRNLADLEHLFITVNLPLGQTARESFDSVAALPGRVKWLEGSIACVEYVPTPHAHMLVKRTALERYHRGNIIKVLSRALAVKPEKVDIKLAHTREAYANRLGYIQGTKVDEAKMAKCAQDAKIREAWDIPQYFTLGA